jgi:hypothetical protein
MAALRACRGEVLKLLRVTGQRTPLTREAEALVAQIDAVAMLSRIPGALQMVDSQNPQHSTSDMSDKR